MYFSRCNSCALQDKDIKKISGLVCPAVSLASGAVLHATFCKGSAKTRKEGLVLLIIFRIYIYKPNFLRINKQVHRFVSISTIHVMCR